MLIRLIGTISGTRDGVAWPDPGVAFELPDGEAAQLIDNHMAVPVVDPERGVETAVVDSPVEKRKSARDALVK